MILNEPIVEEQQEVALKRSQRKGQLFQITMWYLYTLETN